ncbi:MAG TPA: small ribosomal subunit Rsm22 family protein [Opitutaceae bacterium]|nr:small ribosomal subunit Rsm22 family protein [Opitutaceae bacterium]
MTWADLDWPALDRLRSQFLAGTSGGGSYWKTAADLASYDFTYGERIGWKWDHVLRELRLRGWRPGSRAVFDWGCGSGIAARRVISSFGAENFDALTLWDHSALACDYAGESARKKFPSLRVAQATPGLLVAGESIGLLIVSHVLNELAPAALAELRGLIARADAVLWVEPGTHAVSRQLGVLRDELRASFRIVAPCTHENPCPILLPGSERHWCHFFAPPPPEIFADSNWVKFGQRAGIDLRSLPYCFIALDRAPAATPRDATLSRVIGRPEHFKPYARLLNCDASGLAELELSKRANPALYKELERSKAPLVYRWQREGAKLADGEAAGATPS